MLLFLYSKSAETHIKYGVFAIAKTLGIYDKREISAEGEKMKKKKKKMELISFCFGRRKRFPGVERAFS